MNKKTLFMLTFGIGLIQTGIVILAFFMSTYWTYQTLWRFVIYGFFGGVVVLVGYNTNQKNFIVNQGVGIAGLISGLTFSLFLVKNFTL